MLYFIFTACAMPSNKRQYIKSNSSAPEKPPEKVKKSIARRKDISKSRKVLFEETSIQNEPDVSVSNYNLLLNITIILCFYVDNNYFCYADKYVKSSTMVRI